MRKPSIGAGTAVISDMAKKKQLILTALCGLCVCTAVILFNIFSSPEFSRYVPPEETITSFTAADKEGLIDLNTADENELSSLNGIGEKRARAIIEYREKNGRFVSVDELINIDGIGQKLFESIKSRLTV